MSAGYRAIGWNRQKRIYDGVLVAGIAAYLIVFAVAGVLFHPDVTVETLLIRGTGSAARAGQASNKHTTASAASRCLAPSRLYAMYRRTTLLILRSP